MEQSKIFNYADIIYSCLIPEDTVSEYRMPAHVLIYVYSGEMHIDDRGHEQIVSAGEYIFIGRDNRVKILKHAQDDKAYKAISIRFDRNFLRSYFHKIDRRTVPEATERFKAAAIKLPKTLYLDSLFLSLFPYTDSGVEPSEEFIAMKMQEAVRCLLTCDARFYPTLFDFNEQWKIDLMEFMEQNYTQDMSLEEFATYTGRSLATFKRDFARISDLPPQKWLIRKRLEAAYEMIRDRKTKVSDVYLEVGFKNRSHFTVAFKKQYGQAPGAVV